MFEIRLFPLKVKFMPIHLNCVTKFSIDRSIYIYIYRSIDRSIYIYIYRSIDTKFSNTIKMNWHKFDLERKKSDFKHCYRVYYIMESYRICFAQELFFESVWWGCWFCNLGDVVIYRKMSMMTFITNIRTQSIIILVREKKVDNY